LTEKNLKKEVKEKKVPVENVKEENTTKKAVKTTKKVIKETKKSVKKTNKVSKTTKKTKTSKKTEPEQTLNLMNHELIPKHILLTEEEKQEVMDKYKLKKTKQFPRIKKGDPIVKMIGGKPDDLIKIERKSNVYYRIVVDD